MGDFLRFKSCVLYTQLDKLDCPLINIEVVAHVTSPEIRSSEVKSYIDDGSFVKRSFQALIKLKLLIL